MKKRWTIFNLAVVFLSLLLMLGLGVMVTRSEHYSITEEKIRQIADIYAHEYNTSPDYTKKLNEDIRVTVIDSAGRVIADSETIDLSASENHIMREEVVAALNGSPKTVTRYSDTLHCDMMYYAEKVTSGEDYVFVRVAIPVKSVDSYVLKSVVPMLFIFLFSLAVSVLASSLFGGGLLRPLETVRAGLAGIESGHYRAVAPTTDDDEINRMLSDINIIGARLQDSMQTVQHEKEKLDYILNHISDGIVVLDPSLTIIMLNRRAEEIFGVRQGSGRGVQVLTVDPGFTAAVQGCASGGSGNIFQMEQDGCWYLCTAHRAEKDLIMVVLTDITASKNNEKMRLEFFANASHELKTPLTTIKGFNDMIALRTQDEQIRTYAQHIEKESARMLSLIDDMLDLNRLEHSVPDKAALPLTDLRQTADEVAESLRMLAKERKVELTISGAGTLPIEQEHAYELIKNLTENAIRYNREGGHAHVEIAKDPAGVHLTVQDDGIGIDSSHQSRIFERFYRVDKSRSRATGGTGLGLAIVKHICELYGAELSLSSRLGDGTTIRITFPES